MNGANKKTIQHRIIFEGDRKENPSDALLQLWSIKPEATVQNLIALLKDTDLERIDVATILENWVEGQGSK